MPMLPELKTEWVTALRSGNYVQGKSVLKDSKTGRFCCLGVLCAIDPRIRFDRLADHVDGTFSDGVRHLAVAAEYETDEGVAISTYGVLPLSYRQKIGISDENERTLIAMNDDGKKFSTIANFIERNL